MSCNFIPARQLISLVVLVDDRRNFLTSLELVMNQHDIPCKSFVDPFMAKDYLSKNSQLNQSIENCIQSLAYYDLEDPKVTDNPVNIDIPSLIECLYDKERFYKPILGIFDYSMKPIDGLTLSKQVKEESNNKLKIIMLTGEASPEVGIAGFNEQSIDRFIIKDDPNLYDKLINSIETLSQQYFEKESETIIRSLSKNPQCLYMDADYIRFFYRVKEDLKAVEHVIIDEVGSAIFLKENGEMTWLLIKSKQQIIQDHEELGENNFDQGLLDTIKRREKFIYFMGEMKYSDLDNHLFESTPLSSNQEYYYSLVEGDKSPFKINSKVISFYETVGVK